jgi:hypothetical protein
MWRSTHTWTTPGVNPNATELDIEWLYAFAVIDSIVDVSGDQGGWARIHFTRSGLDFADETSYPITEYFVFGRVDNPAMTEAVLANGQWSRWDAGQGDIKLSPVIGTDAGRPVSVRYNGRTFVERRSAANGGPPPGLWEVLGAVTAGQVEHYTVDVPTLCDSTSSFFYAVYCISAETPTPSVYYYSPPDSGYSVDNVAPTTPQGFTLAYNTVGGNVLTWQQCPDGDFQYYKIYRGENEAFTPGPSSFVHATVDTTWTDPVPEGWRYYYKTTTLDYVGNESEASSPTTVTGAGPGVTPETTYLYQNVPNPFNPSTEIRFDIPRRMNVRLEVFNVRGQRIRVLASGELDPGRKSYYWRGRDDGGNSVASGVYFYRLETSDYSQTRKMILLR